MVQELIDLRTSILKGRSEDALAIIDELEGMSKQAIIRNIESFLLRLFVHLIKNQVEQKLTNSWAASIVDSVRQIKKLNLKDNQKSYYIQYYIQQDEWQSFLEEALDAAMISASVEVAQGAYTPKQLNELVNHQTILIIAQNLLDFTYSYSPRELLTVIQDNFADLPGGKDWLSKRE